jgi:endonuclease-3
MTAMSPRRAVRPEGASSVAPIALLSRLPASYPRNDHRTATTSDIPPNPPSCAIGNVAAMPRSYVREARRRVGPKRERIRPIIERLKAAHPDAGIALRSRGDLELLVAVMLSAQTTDVNVNKVTEKLFAKYRRPEDYLAVPPAELERDIFATGFFRQKTKALRGTMKMLLEDFDGRVPDDFDDLLRLPGVARKTANVVSAERGRPVGIVVDTHVRRLSQRLGLTKHEDPVKIEQDLMRLVPREEWAIFPHLLIWHGRRVCIARRPLCEECALNDLCPSSRVDVVPALRPGPLE